MSEKWVLVIDEPIHEWFGLSYAQYLVLPRSILQSMPVPWQRKLVKLLREQDETIPLAIDQPVSYWVYLKNEEVGKRIAIDNDQYCDYERGRRRLTPLTQKKEER